jgi:DNA-directed RNA polymerase subunit RPC12/RpoP
MSSHFDNTFYLFRCATCGMRFKKILRVLVDSDEVRCPRCHAIIDIRDSKRIGDINEALAIAAQQDRVSVTRN